MVDGFAGRAHRRARRPPRSRVVLGERQAAAAALDSAEVHFNDDQGSLALIEETRKALGLDAGQ